jgi:hypothetical protein
MFAELEELRDALADIEGVTTAKIGYEEGVIAPSDYPIVRLVPTRVAPGRPYQPRRVELAIIFGEETTKSEGLELVYERLCALEVEIIRTLKGLGGSYLATITDEDRISTFKLMQVQCEIDAAAVDPPDPSP